MIGTITQRKLILLLFSNLMRWRSNFIETQRKYVAEQLAILNHKNRLDKLQGCAAVRASLLLRL